MAFLNISNKREVSISKMNYENTMTYDQNQSSKLLTQKQGEITWLIHPPTHL